MSSVFDFTNALGPFGRPPGERVRPGFIVTNVDQEEDLTEDPGHGTLETKQITMRWALRLS